MDLVEVLTFSCKRTVTETFFIKILTHSFNRQATIIVAVIRKAITMTKFSVPLFSQVSELLSGNSSVYIAPRLKVYFHVLNNKKDSEITNNKATIQYVVIGIML